MSNDKTGYESSIVLGEKYRDDQTGIEGVATAVTFFQFACERVSIEWVSDGEINEFTFDAPRLRRVSTGERVESEKTGGPNRGSSHVRPGHLGRR